MRAKSHIPVWEYALAGLIGALVAAFSAELWQSVVLFILFIANDMAVGSRKYEQGRQDGIRGGFNS